MLAKFIISGSLLGDILGLPEDAQVVRFQRTDDGNLTVFVDLPPDVVADKSNWNGDNIEVIPEVTPVFRRMIISHMEFLEWSTDYGQQGQDVSEIGEIREGHEGEEGSEGHQVRQGQDSQE